VRSATKEIESAATGNHKLAYMISSYGGEDVNVGFEGSYCIQPVRPSALKMEIVCFSETLVSTYKSTWRYNPK
jgi:hypothetical protein